MKKSVSKMCRILTLLVLLLHRTGTQLVIGASSWSSRAALLDASSPPSFVANTMTHVVVARGRDAKLQCRVRNIADRAVSWMRQRDLHILSMAKQIYTGDSRFNISNEEKESDLWTLLIDDVRKEDSGVYECQINTEPKASKRFVLQVVEPRAEIVGDRDVMVDRGSDLTLVCNIVSSPEAPELIGWVKDDNIRVEDELVLGRGGGVSVVTDSRNRRSRLVLAKVNHGDQGKYACLLNRNESQDAVHVHVIKGLDPSTVVSKGPLHSALSPLSPLLLLVTVLAVV